jgi:hypothetical protein
MQSLKKFTCPFPFVFHFFLYRKVEANTIIKGKELWDDIVLSPLSRKVKALQLLITVVQVCAFEDTPYWLPTCASETFHHKWVLFKCFLAGWRSCSVVNY